MAQKLFKGFKQVLAKTYEGTTDKSGYIWFVRTPKNEDGVLVNGEVADDNNLLNDSYDIYFGDKHYGHYMAGEVSTLAKGVEEIMKSIGLSPAYKYVPKDQELTDALNAMQAEVGEEKQTLSRAIDYIFATLKTKLDSATFEQFKKDNQASLDKKAGYAELSDDGKTISFFKDNSTEKRDVLFTIDSSQFVKDGMLKDVEITTPAKLGKDITYGVDEKGQPKVYHSATEGEKDVQFLHFIWEVASYKKDKSKTVTVSTEKEDFILLTDIAPIYSADETSISKSVDNVFSVKEVKTDITKTNADITIEGGPLAEGLKDAYPGGVLPSGTTMQEILTKLLCVEKWPTAISETAGTHSSSLDNPSISLSPSGIVEVGTTISVTAKNGASKNKVTAPSVSGFKFGYSTADNNTKEFSADTKTGAITNNSVLVNESTLTVSGAASGTVKGTKDANTANYSGSFKAVEGTNSVSVQATGATFTATFEEIPVLYGCSNLKNTHDEKGNTKVSKLVPEKTINTAAITSDTVTANVTGVYPVFCNGVEGTGNGLTDKESPLSAPTVDKQLSLREDGKAYYIKFAKHAIAPYTVYIKHGMKITSAIGINGLTNNYDLKTNHDKYVLKGQKDFIIQGNVVSYDQYDYLATEGANGVKFTFSK